MNRIDHNTVDDSTPTLTMREFLRNPKKASALLRHGHKINVTNNGTLLFVATPPAQTTKKSVTGRDFAHLIIDTPDTDLSTRVDQIVYGA